ncbi:MAG: type II toxin-antitoxin system RelE family toxin [Hydrogenovibrio sp.]
MSYKLVFKEQALKEWRKLDTTLQVQFKKKLQERLIEPCVESAKLKGLEDCYKIKLRSAGYRLVYQVREEALIVSVIAIGKRDRNHVYQSASDRL